MHIEWKNEDLDQTAPLFVWMLFNVSVNNYGRDSSRNNNWARSYEKVSYAISKQQRCRSASYFWLPTSYFLLLTSDFQLLTSFFLLLTSYFWLPTSDFQLLTSYFQNLTSDFLLPTSSDVQPPTFNFLLLTSKFNTPNFLLLTSWLLSSNFNTSNLMISYS